MTASALGARVRQSAPVDALGTVLAAMLTVGIVVGPFAALRPNRILDGAPVSLLSSLPPAWAVAVATAAVLAACIAVLRTPPVLRLAASLGATIVLVLAVGRAPARLVAPEDVFGRVGPGWGFWLALAALGLLAADAGARMKAGPWPRLVWLSVGAAAVAAIFLSGALDQLSLMKEYASRSSAFWAEAARHVALSFGSVAAAVAIGAPIGVFLHLRPGPGAPVIGALAALQSVPSIALFGLLIAPLGWLAAHVPGAAAIGVAGVGAAPAYVALTLYALFPVVATVASGLSSTPRDVLEAARASGMSERQAMWRIKAPLAAPSLLAGLRVVTVQTIGLATIAALIGAGGFGTFVFQGAGQTATDLVLLGAGPTVALALVATVVIDAAADIARRRVA